MQLPKVYEPGQYESSVYELWEQNDVFKPKKRGGKTWSMVFPLPNANASVHLGHGLTNAVYDVVARYHRMKGDATLYLPGSDHAGFETQVVYEKKLAKEGKSRFDFSREELYTQIYGFVEENRSLFQSQFKRLGASCDWSRYTFTLDDHIVKRAYATFKKMWDDGLIYRGERLVNYCTFHGTGFADVEVQYETVKTPLYYMKYGPFELATTRPETKFGDTAVAVHPDDTRYKKWVGKTVAVEGVNGPFEVRVVADEMVDPNFGTGVVKITPAHSFDDWEVAKRHNLQAVRVINHDGRLNHLTGPYEGMTVMEARKAVAKKLEELGLMIKVDHNYETRIGKCYKCGTVIEPMLMDQWFIDMQPLAKPAIEVLKKDKITFYPTSKRDQLVNYLENLRDWNISRQIAWGIPIPAFQNVDDPDDWIYDERVGEHTLEIEGKTYRRDPDVFDTWFSSSSWPYATLHYPDGEDFKNLYPTNFLDTGGEILYPWVSRMVMLGLYVAGDIPFREVYIHGYVMAEDGSKMSKSVGNVIDPVPVMDKYGSDALRMGLLAGRSPAVNRGYDPRRVEEARNFCNKLWNVARYASEKLGETYQLTGTPKPQTNADNWVLGKLNHTIETVTSCLETFRFAEAYDTIYHFVWDDLADWYIEASKTDENKAVLAYVIDQTLRLAHPFAPFLTETLWQNLSWTTGTLLAIEKWPSGIRTSPQAAAEFAEVQSIVTEVRAITRALGVRSGNLYYTDVSFLRDNAAIIARMTGLANVQEVSDGTGLFLTTTKHRCWLDIDPTLAQAHLTKLADEKNVAVQRIAQLEGRLCNKSYVKNAPKKIVEDTKAQLEESRANLERISAEYDRFNTLG